MIDWGFVFRMSIILGVLVHLGINLVDFFNGGPILMPLFRVSSEIFLTMYLANMEGKIPCTLFDVHKLKD